MKRYFTMEYWIDDEWYVGRLKEIPGVFSQGATLEELEDNVKDAYQLLIEDKARTSMPPGARTKEIVFEVA